MITALLVLNVIFWLIALIEAVIGYRTIYRLEDITANNQYEPLVSVIIAARNEELSIKRSIQSQFQQHYKNIEWIAINDRSTDKTGEILDCLQRENEKLKAVHIKDLPKGWLGKNYALYQGYQHSNGDYLVFTDADVMYHPDTIGKAVTFLDQQNIDHLTVSPNLDATGFWLRAFVAFFLFGFSFFKRPWMANVDSSKIGMGIGAFNLITRDAYDKIGTHKAIAMRPDDDLQLGYKIKKLGLRQRIVTGITLLKVKWYDSLKAALIGLEKNTFAGLHYRLSMVFIAMAGTFLSHVLPFITLFSARKLHLFLSIITILLIFSLYILVTRRMTSFSPFNFIAFPFTALLFIYSIGRASFLTFKRGGIVWRGTKYSLKELRKR